MLSQIEVHPLEDAEFIKGLEWWIEYVEYQKRKEEELLRIAYEHDAECYFNLEYSRN